MSFHYQNLIAGDQAYEYVIGKFVQITALYEDFRANFSNGGRLRLWDCSQLQSWRSPPMCGRLVQASDPLMMAYACRTRPPSRTGRIARAESCKRRGGAG